MSYRQLMKNGTMKKNKSEEALTKISPERREFVRKAASAGFVLPAVATFSMSGLIARPAAAQPNGTLD